MDRRSFLTAIAIAPSAATVATRAVASQNVIYLRACPSLWEATLKGVCKAELGAMSVLRQASVEAAEGVQIDEFHASRQTWGYERFHAAVILERAEACRQERVLEAIRAVSASVVRLSFIDAPYYSQTRRGMRPATIILSAQRQPSQTIIRIPLLWEDQLARQFDTAPKADDASAAADDVEKVGRSMSEIFWRGDRLVVDLLATLLPMVARGETLEDAVAAIHCRWDDSGLRDTRVSRV